MVFKKSWSRQRHELINQQRQRPIISFRVDLENQQFLNKLAMRKQRSKFINQAINRNIYFTLYPKKFTIDWIKEHFGLCKHLLRQIGRGLQKEGYKYINPPKKTRQNAL